MNSSVNASTPPASTAQPPTPEPIFSALMGFQLTAALRTAIELDLFTAIASGAATAPAIAKAVQASERGVRILCDYLTVCQFLAKRGQEYTLVPVSALFLDRRAPTYVGSMARFLADPRLHRPIEDLTATVRAGRPEGKSVESNWDGWVEFARSMTPMMAPQAAFLAERFAGDEHGTVLDIAAGHGLFGLAFARRNPRLKVVALDWPAVLTVAKENASAAGVDEKRYQTLPGDALAVPFGEGYRFVLFTNFLHHFDRSTCEQLLRKAYAALEPGGQVVVLEFVPNEDRVTPPFPARFSLTMLAETQGGDAYTWPEYQQMCHAAGFAGPEIEPVPHSPQHVISARRE